MMRKTALRRGFAILAVLLLIFLSISQPANAQENESSLLWRIEGNGIQPSTIYGTFHLLPQKDFELRKKVTEAFDAAEQIVLELDMDDPQLQLKMMEFAPLTDGNTMDQLLDPDDYALIDRVLQATIGSGLDQYNAVKPFVISSVLLPTLIEGRPASYEATFAQMAVNAKKEVIGLESVEEQMTMFEEIPIEVQVAEILDIVKNREVVKGLFEKMIRVYNEEDTEELYKMLSMYMDGENELEYLITRRNKAWIPRIGDLAAEKGTFFGVGAGHLGGPDGVIELLKGAGYELTPIME